MKKNENYCRKFFLNILFEKVLLSAMKLVFATNNKNKLNEVKNLISSVEIISLADINCFENIPETSETLEGNASQKAFYIFNKYKINCFADDTGLEIDALGGKPGVKSARYAGDDAVAENNIQKVLEKLKGIENRKAKFKTVISLVIEGNEKQFMGTVNGKILTGKSGGGGFGYDPIFVPDGFKKTFAEMNLEEKNKISHRAIAVKKIVEWLNYVKKET